jgi:hypothetical protein
VYCQVERRRGQHRNDAGRERRADLDHFFLPVPKSTSAQVRPSPTLRVGPSSLTIPGIRIGFFLGGFLYDLPKSGMSILYVVDH